MSVAFVLLVPLDFKLVIIVQKIHNHVHSIFQRVFPCYTQYTLKVLCVLWQQIDNCDCRLLSRHE